MEEPSEIVSPPSLTVIIPTYNGERYLHAALASLADSSSRPSEVLLVDDGSTDNTLGIAAQFSSDLSLEVFANERFGNWVRSTNFALRRAKGEFVTFLHQDDLWLPDRMARFESAVRRHPNADVFVNASKFVDEGGQSRGRWHTPLVPGMNEGRFVAENLIIQNFVAIPGVIFRRRLLDSEIASGREPLDESLWYTADWDLWITLANRGAWYYEPEPLTAFRIHSQSITAGAGAQSSLRTQFSKVIDKHLSDCRLSEDPLLERLVRFSAEVNIALLQMFQGTRPRFLPLLADALRLTPNGLKRYLRVSRIGQRAGSRIRVFGQKSLKQLLP